MQQYSVHEVKNRSIRTNAEGERPHRDHGEPKISAKAAACVEQILREILEPASAHVSDRLFDWPQISEFPERSPFRFVPVHTGRQVVFDKALAMESQLVPNPRVGCLV